MFGNGRSLRHAITTLLRLKMKPKPQGVTTRHGRSDRAAGKNWKIKPVQRAKNERQVRCDLSSRVAYHAIRGVDVEPNITANDTKDSRLRSIERCGIYAILFDRNGRRAA
jgi:hypothetical protein